MTSSDETGPDASGPEEKGPDVKGSDENDPEENGPDASGPEEKGPDVKASEENGSDENGPDASWEIADQVTRPRGRRIAVVVVAVAVVLALGAGALLLLPLGDTETSEPPRDTAEVPEQWDPEVAAIADFVEDERGLDWEHPVPIRYLDDEAFVEELTADLEDPDDEDRESLEQAEALYQALGLLDADANLLEELGAVMGSGVLAYYDYEVGEIVMRGDEITPALRVTLAHELTHALQDQHFDLYELFEDAEESGGSLAARAVVEGDATRVEDAYVATLSAEDQELARDYGDDINEAAQGLVDVEDAILAFFSAPYVVGPTFLEVIAASDGEDAIDDLFVPDIPELALVAPARFLDGIDQVEVDAPQLPDGAEAIDEPEPFGAVGLYMVLSGRLDAFDVLDVVDGWAGDSMQLYELDGSTCVAAAFRGVDDEATDAIAESLTTWAELGPTGQATVTEEDDDVVLRSCGGSDAIGPTESISEAVTIIPLRHVLYLEVNAGGVPLDASVCVVDRLLADGAIRSAFRSIAAGGEPTEAEGEALTELAEGAALECLVE